MKYTHISNVLATTKRTNGTPLALMILGLATLLFLACPEPTSNSSGSSGAGGSAGDTPALTEEESTSAGGSDPPPNPTEWTVAFNTKANKDDTAVSTETVENGETVSKPSTNPTKTEDTIVKTYTFISWHAEKERTTPFDFDTPITKDTALYAKWGVVLKEGITTIPNDYFKDVPLAGGTEIPNTVKTIDYGAFENTGLTSITIPKGVTVIEPFVFANNKLKAVTIPKEVTHIGDNAFVDNKLMTVIIPDKVTTIGPRAFANNALTAVAIEGKALVAISDNAFANNPLETVTIKRKNRNMNIGSIADSAFKALVPPTLTKVVMPKALHTTLKGPPNKLKDGTIFTFKDGTPYYEDIDTGNELK